MLIQVWMWKREKRFFIHLLSIPYWSALNLHHTWDLYTGWPKSIEPNVLRHWRHTTGHLRLMGNLCRCLFTLTVKNCFFISNLNLPSSFARLDTQSSAFTCISCGTCTSALHICLSGEDLWLCRAWIFRAVYAYALCIYSLCALASSI